MSSRSQTAPAWQWLYVLLLIATIIWASSHGQVAGPKITNFDKLAHFSVFGLMATLVLRQVGIRRWWLALLLVSAFGATDEIHQSFTPGRSADIRDWVADTLGAITAIALYSLVGPYRRLLETRPPRKNHDSKARSSADKQVIAAETETGNATT
ncbi:VanZ family protein [Geminisphaera colitermitum]|uniref:VanZ family protein n=1 Tax=Geminisphaera colitermitum TaxID=1148786 RepID=UPI000158D419